MGVSRLKKVFISHRAVSPIIATVLLLGIIVVGVSFVYFLAVPIITRMQDTAMIRRVENSMLLLGDNILTVVNEGHSSERITQFSYGKGMLYIYPESIDVTFELLYGETPFYSYSQSIGKVEYSVDTSSDIVSPDSRIFIRGWHWNFVNGTQGEPNSDIDRIIIQRIGSSHVKLLLDFRSRFYNHTDSDGNIHLTLCVVKLMVDPLLGSGIGGGTFSVAASNQDVIVTNYNYTFVEAGTFTIQASQEGTVERAFSCWVPEKKSVNVEFVVTEVEVGIL